MTRADLAMSTKRRCRARVLALIVPFALVGLVLPMTAANASPVPGVPNASAVSTTSSSITVTVPAAADATEYRLYASTTRDYIHVVEINMAIAGPITTSRTLTLTGLPYTTAPYNYRVEDYNTYHHNWSDIMQTYLQPATVSSVTVHSSSSATYLTWAGESATGYQVAQASTPDMITNRYDYTVRGGTVTQFTPYGMEKGTTYYFHVRALNGTTPGHYSARATGNGGNFEQYSRVMTFNIRSIVDGDTGLTVPISPWSDRRIAAAKLINEASPDVIGIQEGASWVAADRGPRQVDDLRSVLGTSVYSLATTEIPPSQPNYHRTGNYILYKSATYSTVGAGGHWDIGGAWGVYQELRSRDSGAAFLFVTTHLSPGAGSSYDTLRQNQTSTMISDAKKLAAKDGGIPIVYAGDFNSDLSSVHAFDGPGQAMLPSGNEDGLVVARFQTNPQYDSGNQYLRTPPADGFSIDHVYAPLGVGVRSWKLYQDVSNGSFVGTIASDHDPIVSDLSIPYRYES